MKIKYFKQKTILQNLEYTLLSKPDEITSASMINLMDVIFSLEIFEDCRLKSKFFNKFVMGSIMKRIKIERLGQKLQKFCRRIWGLICFMGEEMGLIQKVSEEVTNRIYQALFKERNKLYKREKLRKSKKQKIEKGSKRIGDIQTRSTLKHNRSNLKNDIVYSESFWKNLMGIKCYLTPKDMLYMVHWLVSPVVLKEFKYLKFGTALEEDIEFLYLIDTYFSQFVGQTTYDIYIERFLLSGLKEKRQTVETILKNYTGKNLTKIFE